MSKQIIPLFYHDVEIRADSDGLISLTDMWIATGKPEGKNDPGKWSRAPRKVKSGTSGKISEVTGEGRQFVDFLAETLNVSAGHIIRTKRGRDGGTWAHWQIALAYAKYLSHEFHAWANQVVKERIEEDRNPELGIDRSRKRAIAAWKRKGRSEDYIKARLAGIDARNVFTDTLSEHGVKGKGFAICTNNIYRPILGGTAAKVRKERGLPKKANVREAMSEVELAGTMFAEILASDRIKREERHGLKPCADACLESGHSVKKTIERHEKAILPAS